MKVRIILVFLFLLNVSLFSKNIILLTDVSQGLSKNDAREINNLIKPSKEEDGDIYQNGDNVIYYIMTENDRKPVKGRFVDFYQDKKKHIKFYKKVYNKYAKGLKHFKKINATEKVLSRDIVLLLDTSGSVNRQEIVKYINKQLVNISDNKGKNVSIAIVTFNGHESLRNMDKAQLIQNFTNNFNETKSTLKNLKFSNLKTYMGSGFELSLNILSKSNAERKMILLVSDGLDISDEENLKMQLNKANQVNIDVMAVGGASIDKLKEISTDGYVYNTTTFVLEDVIMKSASKKDPILDNFASISSNVFSKCSGDDIFIIYSSMMERGEDYDFYTIGDLSSRPFYDELNSKLENNSNIDFKGMNVYVKLTGNPSAKKENELRSFWKQFIMDHNGKLAIFSKDPLEIDSLRH